MKHKWMSIIVSLAIALSVWGLMPAGTALAQSEDEVVINEFVVNPATGKEYVESVGHKARRC